jgi:hypothetical protein
MIVAGNASAQGATITSPNDLNLGARPETAAVIGRIIVQGSRFTNKNFSPAKDSQCAGIKESTIVGRLSALVGKRERSGVAQIVYNPLDVFPSRRRRQAN